MPQTEHQKSFVEICDMRLEDSWQQLTADLNAIHGNIVGSDDKFYASGVEALAVLDQARTILQEGKENGILSTANMSDTLLKLVSLVPESEYKRVFSLVRFCLVDTIYDQLAESKGLVKKYEAILFQKLEELHHLIDKEDGEKVGAFEIHQWHDGEFIGASEEEKKEIIESLGTLQSLLKEEMPIVLRINSSSDNLAVKEALLALRNTECFLSDNPPMKKFGGTFQDIANLSDERALNLLDELLRGIQAQCENGSRQLNIAVANAEEVINKNRLDPYRHWLEVARRIQDIPPEMPEDALWHDAIFSIARFSYIAFISGALETEIIPTIEKLAPNTPLAKETKRLSFCVKEGNHQEIRDMLPTLHVGAFRTTVSDPLQAQDEVVSLLALVAALLWRIVPVLLTINDLSDNSAIKQALVDLRRELNRNIDQVETVFALSEIGLSW